MKKLTKQKKLLLSTALLSYLLGTGIASAVDITTQAITDDSSVTSTVTEEDTNKILAGKNNTITNGTYTTISGGEKNTIKNAKYSGIHGGEENNIEKASDSDIYGGSYNQIKGGAQSPVSSVILGGVGNIINGEGGSLEEATIVGGWFNTAYSSETGLFGGSHNISYQGIESSIFGGEENKLVAGSSARNWTEKTVVGGYQNLGAGYRATILGGTQNFTYGTNSVAMGGTGSKVLATDGIGIGGGSVLSVAKKGIAIGADAICSEENTISFGHNTGDAQITVSWQKNSDGNDDYTKDPTVDETGTTYTTASYNRLVKVADGVDDHDVTTVGQVKKLVADSSYTGNDDINISDDHVISVSKNGKVALNDTGLVTGDTVWKTINSGRKVLETGDYSDIGENSITLGGTSNWGLGKDTSIIGGSDNIAQGELSSAFGGNANHLTGKYATAVGGIGNTASGNNTLVAGGSNNNATAETSTAVGGQFGTASGDYSTVIGGSSMTASGKYSVAIGGNASSAMGTNSTVIGGAGQNLASGSYDLIAGGAGNKTSNSYSTVYGGSDNISSGWASTVLGGQSSYSTGAYSASINNRQGKVIGDYGTALGGGESLVLGQMSTSIGGGSTGQDAMLSTAIGYKSLSTVANGTAVGYQAVQNKEGTISFGHDTGDVSGYSVAWQKGSDGNTDYSQSPTITEKTYDSAYYNRLVKVADGIDDHDVATVGQLKTMIAGVSGSSIIEYTYGSGLTVTDKGTNDSGKAVKEIDLNHSLYTNLGDVDNYGKKLTINNNGKNSFIIGGTYKNESYDTTFGNEGDYSVVLGGTNNYITSSSHSSVAIGGYYNFLYSDNSVVTGGIYHSARGEYSVISGGQGNRTEGQYSSIFGGYSNKTTGEWSSVFGGISNEANGEKSTVVGGSNNIAKGNISLIAGSYSSKAEGFMSSIFGGLSNTNYADESGIFSGLGNNIYNGSYSAIIAGSSNSIYGSGYESLIAGSKASVATSSNAVILGGSDLKAHGYSTIVGGEYTVARGYMSTAVGGKSGILLGEFGAAVGGGSIGKDASNATAIGNKSLSTKENGLALGYQAVQNTDGTISFGHDAGDVSGYELSWKEKTIPDNLKNDYYYTKDKNDYSKDPTVTETTYDTAYYNRLVKVADGIDDHDVATVGQTKSLISSSISDAAYTAGDDIIISENRVISVSKAGQVASGDNGLVTGNTVYQITNKLATNIAEQQTALNATKSQLNTLNTSIEGIRKNVLAINNTVSNTIADLSSTMGTFVNQDLSNISDDGRMVLKDLIKAELKSQNGASTSSTSPTKQISMSLSPVVTMSMIDGLDTNDSAKVTVENNTKETANSAVDQSYVDSALSKKADKVTVDAISAKVDTNTKNIVANTEAIKVNAKDISDLKENKADKDGSNINVASWSEKLGTGTVSKDDKGLVTGGTVFSALEGKADLDYVNSGFAGLSNQMQMMNQNLTKDINNGVAAASALAALKPLDYDSSDKFNFAVGYGHYKNANSTALGAFYYANADTMFNFGATIGNGTPALNAGLSFKLGKGSSYAGVSKADLVKDNIALHQEVAQQNATIMDQQETIDKQSKRIDEIEKLLKELMNKQAK